MSKPRIPRKPKEVLELLEKVAAGIGNEPAWPATAPNQNAYQTQSSFQRNAINLVESLELQLTQARAALHTTNETSIKDFLIVGDTCTTFMYGKDGVKKLNFGYEPEKSTAGPSIPLDQCLITEIRDGRQPASLFVDWDTEDGAASYEFEWFLDSGLTQVVGHTAVSNSEIQLTGLIPATQYWVHVRALRGSEKGRWSDPATRIANT